MSISAINSVSLYEYYYSIPQKNNKKTSLEQNKEVNIQTPSSNQLHTNQLSQKDSLNQIEENKSLRPWADLMYQLGLEFNDKPEDDILCIKDELSKLVLGLDDDEITREVNDLESSISKMYVSFELKAQNKDSNNAIEAQLDNMSIANLSRFI